MTREERENALHCLKVMIDEEVCEECNLYGTTGTDHCEADCVRVAIKALEQESVIDKIRAEIADYGSICVSYAITGRKDSDIERLVKGVLKQAKEQVLEIIDKYREEQEET